MAGREIDLQGEKSEDHGNEIFLKPVYRPWYVYLMAVWAFLGIGGLVAFS